MKPSLSRNVSADCKAMLRVLGPRFGKLFSPNPDVREYAAVLRWESAQCVTGGEVRRTLKKIEPTGGKVLLAARDFTVEAREIAFSADCDVLTESDFFWTDEGRQSIRLRQMALTPRATAANGD